MFNPTRFKHTIITSGIFLVSYEMLIFSLVRRLKEFYDHTDGGKIEDNYNSKVLSLTKEKPHSYVASCLWFKKEGAITDEDIEIIRQIRIHRDEIAHRLMYIIDSKDVVDLELLQQLVRVVKKIDIWWMRYIETDYGNELPDSEFSSGNIILLDLLVPIANGDDSKLEEFYNSGRKILEMRKNVSSHHKRT